MSYNNNPYQSNPYQQGPAQESGYGYNQQESHELQQYGQPGQPYGQPAGPSVLSQTDFLARVANVRTEIGGLREDLNNIANAHNETLKSSDGSPQGQLENLVAQTQLKNTSIRDQIHTLQIDAQRTPDASGKLKKRQFEALNNDFKKEVLAFLQEEQQYKQRYRDQIARQYKIVNPDATDDQLEQAVNADWGNEGIFQTALRTNRSGQASAVLGNVRARHNELQKIEQSIMELAGLFQDLDTLVVQQEAIVQQAEESTEQTNINLHKGTQEVDKGIVSARRARKLKWWCLGITVLIILIIALVVGLYFGLNKASKS